MQTRRSGGAALIALSLLVTACSSGQGSSAAPSSAAGSAPAASSGGGESTAPSSAGASQGASEGASQGAAASPATIEASGNINAFGMSYDTGDTIAKERIDYVREKYPDVKVKFSESGFDPQQFVTALQSSAPPDVVSIERWRIGTYVGSGVLEPLDDCISKAGVDMSNYRESAVNSAVQRARARLRRRSR